MLTVEEKKELLEFDINALKQQLRLLQDELLRKERELWWLKRPHVASFENEDWYYESDDNGGNFPVWKPYGVVLSKQWLSVISNQALIDRQLAYIAECNSADYDEDELRDFLICGLSTDIYCEFCDDPYPAFKDAPDTVRNPNYHE